MSCYNQKSVNEVHNGNQLPFHVEYYPGYHHFEYYFKHVFLHSSFHVKMIISSLMLEKQYSINTFVATLLSILL